MTENKISKVIVDSAIEVHRELGGPGLLECAHEESMVEELSRRGMKVERGFESEWFGFDRQQSGDPMESDF